MTLRTFLLEITFIVLALIVNKRVITMKFNIKTAYIYALNKLELIDVRKHFVNKHVTYIYG